MTREEVDQLALAAFGRGVYAKNLLFGYTPDADLGELAFVQEMGGTPGHCAWLVQQAYRKLGVQLQVQREVSDDLIESDFAAESQLRDVPWPGKVVEVYFEDPQLPTIFLMKASPRELEEWFPGLELESPADEMITALMQEGTDEQSKWLSLQLAPEMYDPFMREAQVGQNMIMRVLNSSLEPHDHAALNFMMRLAIKVFAFAAVPHLKPQPIGRKQMHFGGKPDVRGRPNRPAFRAVYLPNVKYDYAEAGPRGEADEGPKHEFLGRRGHFRHLKSDFFKAKRGQWVLVRPTPGPDGLFPSQRVRLMKVRKPE